MNDKLEFAGPNPFTDSPINIKSIYNVCNNDRREIEDFGRESLGIFDLSNIDVGRESMIFLRDDLERESLGIVNLSFLQNDRDFLERESLGIVNLNNLDFGRESLGFFKTDVIPDIKEPEAVLKISLSTIDKNCNSTPSPLNTAFLQLPKVSVSSSTSSLYPSFNSASLGSSGSAFISTISSLSSHNKIDTMNDAFEDSEHFMKRLQLARSSVPSPPSIAQPLSRIKSLPNSLEIQHFEHDLFCGEKNVICKEQERAEEIQKENTFNDSVFIEAKHMASRLADGSFIEEENDMLDSVNEPEDFANIVEEPVKCDTETVFKNVDRMILPEFSLQCNSTKNSSSSTKSREALEMINSLSEMLSTDNLSQQQKSEGQSLLSSLAEIFHPSNSTKSPSCILEDSGHSSIDNNEPAAPHLEGGECFEVLDLRKKSSSETNIHQKVSEEDCHPLDLSMKNNKTFVSPKILPPKLTNKSHQKTIHINKSLGSNASLSSNDSKTSNDSANKFRPKKVDEKGTATRKGPMKAVLPIDNMARRNSLKVTPTRQDSKLSGYKKKTSTPINEPKMKPVAQSTPDNVNKNVYTTSPLARPAASAGSTAKMPKQKLNYSGSRLSTDSKTQLKRTSSGEITKPQKTGRPSLVRSYSAGEKSKPLTSKNKDQSVGVKQRHSYSFQKTENKSVLKENRRSTPTVKTLTGKKIGKENVK